LTFISATEARQQLDALIDQVETSDQPVQIAGSQPRLPIGETHSILTSADIHSDIDQPLRIVPMATEQ
jgi:hypothetical protein